MNKFCSENEIDPTEMDEDVAFLLEVAITFFLTGLHFAANVGGIEVEQVPANSVH